MNTLITLSEKASILKGIESNLNWDQETFMPPGAAKARAVQLKHLAGLYHAAKTSSAFKKALNELIDLKTGKVKVTGLSVKEKGALREWRRDYLIESKLPAAFVEEFSLLTSTAIEVWKYARAENSFQKFAPYLDKIVQMSKKRADFLGYQDHPYDALLDLYEPHLTTKVVEQVFNEVQQFVVPLLQGYKQRKVLFKKTMAAEEQLRLSHEILEKIGYDFNYGRLDLSVHPFSSSSHPTDSRITTRIQIDNPLSNILTTLHEAGHALYEMGLPVEKWGTPMGESASMALHESQSRFWETRIGLSKPFWKWMAPKLGAKSELLYKAVNHVEPGLIRVDADEVTYPLHVILRFRLEKELIEGSIKVRDIPARWNDEMRTLLGISPPDDSQGCLQDIHWALGAFGYFPTYLLGTLYASHLFEKFQKDHPTWEKKVEQGDFLFIKEWLKRKIHQHGRAFPPIALIEKAAGKTFSPKAFLSYLEKKYVAD